MTISTDLARVVHEGNGVTTLFSLSGMEQVKTSNVVVTLVAADGTEMPQVLGADYSLSPAGVTFVVPPAAGVRVVIQRIEPLIQPDQYTTNTPFPAAVTERRFDSVVMGLQQHADAAKRALRAGIEDTANLTVPPVSVRANQLLGFDTQGNVIASPGVQAGGVLFSAFGETFVGSADAAAARALLAVLSSAETNALFSVALLRDGTQPPTANTPWGGFRLTNLGAGTAASDAVTLAQLQTGYRLSGLVWYTSPGSGTYTRPSEVRALRIRAIGGGGGGGGGATYGGGGGGAGGFGETWITSPASSYNYTVGAGGAGGPPGGNGGSGGTTSISSIVANGGNPGLAGTGSNNVGGLGGTVSGVLFGVRGSGGGKGETSTMGVVHLNGGHGGSGYWGGGGGGSIAAGYVGESGDRGGGGAGGAQAGGGTAGGHGGAGVIEIWEFV